MRNMGVVGLLAVLATASALAEDARKPCLGTVQGEGANIDPYSRTDQLDLTDNQCELVTGKELRLKLMEVPQEDEDPMSLSLGAKNLGGVLHSKIPFSF